MMRAQQNVPKRFPFRLHDMLNDAEVHGTDHIVSWLPCGKMFKVHSHKEFANRIMPRYCRHTRYKSFLRQLSMYKFQRINEGEMRGAYHHPNFQRNNLELIELINRNEREGPGTSALPKLKKMAFQKANCTRQEKNIHQKALIANKNTVLRSCNTPRTLLEHEISRVGLQQTSASRQGNTDSSECQIRRGESVEDFELIDFSDEENETLTKINTTVINKSTGWDQRNLIEAKWGDEILVNRHLRPITTFGTSTKNPFPLVNAPEDILDEIISTFGHDGDEPRNLSAAI